MTGKATVLYSSSLALILIALSSVLTNYLASPDTVNMSELKAISDQLNQINAPLTASDTTIPTEIATVMAWWYPGAPACAAIEDAKKVQFDVLKPEYFAIREGGEFEFMTTDRYICNGYSEENVAQVRDLSKEQFVMISSSYAQDMKKFLTQDEIDGRYTNQIVEFVTDADFTGAELDFEDYGGWTPDIYALYKSFVTRLGTALHAEGRQLMIDLPPVRNEAEERWYTFRLDELEKLPIDYIVIMGYDYQFDHGVGEPISPLDWLKEVILFTRNKIQDDSKIVIGLPTYGYIGDKQTQKIQIVTREQASKEYLYDKAERDGRSSELIAESNKEVLVYQDEVSLNAKMEIVREAGIDKVSIWHLGGNMLPTIGN